MDLHEVDRREIFFEIVRLQDQGVSLADCRHRIAERFEIDLEGIREIETEGIAKEWPPL
jgi:hypothetical protein